MQITAALSLLALAATGANAHAHVFGLWVNNAFQGDGRNVYIRSPPNNSPVKDVRSADINCNVNNRRVARSVAVKGGDTVSFEWYHDNRDDDIIDLSHKGPVTVYIAAAASNGQGAVWSKLAEDGFSGGKWAVERLVANRGRHDVKLPAGLAAGEYLLRAEIIALHEGETSFAANPARGAQFYPSCAQISVSGSGSVVPNTGFNFQTGYTATTPGILFNIYGSVSSYPIPGPAVFSGTGGGSVPPPPPPPAATSTVRPVTPTTTARAPVATTTRAPVIVTPTPTPAPQPGNGGAVAQRWQQCGGVNFTGPKQCAQGLRCVVQNPYYHQCL